MIRNNWKEDGRGHGLAIRLYDIDKLIKYLFLETTKFIRIASMSIRGTQWRRNTRYINQQKLHKPEF
jgi:hypothetical protein